MGLRGRTDTAVSAQTSGLSVFSLGIALLGIFLSMPTLALVCGLLGALLALLARRALKADPALRGGRVSLAALVLSIGVVVITAPGVVVGLVGMISRGIRLQFGG